MRKETPPGGKPRTVVVTDDRLIDIVEALTNLIDPWKLKIKQGTLKLQDAVRIGSKLSHRQQHWMKEFIEEVVIPEKYMGKIVHAFSLEMPEWSIHLLLRIYTLAEKTRAAIVMFNDLMDEFEKNFQQFEYDFWEGLLPKGEEELEQVLHDLEASFQELYNQAVDSKRTKYNRTYGDSSSSAKNQVPEEGIPSTVLIGLGQEASPEDIQRQCRRLLKKLHPDQGEARIYLIGSKKPMMHTKKISKVQ
ncbi:molecular chaperone DnaJ [Paenibacillus larvae]